MADRFSKATRSRIMRAIRSRDTKPELALARELRKLRIDFSRRRRLPGSPDFAIGPVIVPHWEMRPRRYQYVSLAVFVHGCFWHLCPRHYAPPAGAGWRRKMDRNRRRDIRVRRQLRSIGWRTMVVWEHDDPERAALRVARRIKSWR